LVLNFRTTLIKEVLCICILIIDAIKIDIPLNIV
jgi:hypothetical protein